MIPLIYNVPLITLGIDDANMVRHFDYDEFTIYQSWKNFYTHGPFYASPFDDKDIYPKAFYNLAGLFLYPYSYIYGEDVKMIMIVLRTMNMLSGIMALMVLFFLVWRVFHSNRVAFLTAFLFGVTPAFLAWTSNVRPNPFEQLMIFSALFFCIRLCEGFSHRWFLLASLFGALAFATKYGGVLFLVFIPALSVYLIRRCEEDRGRWTMIVKRQVQFFRATSPFVTLASGIMLAVFTWSLYNINWDSGTLFMNWTWPALPTERVVRVSEILEKNQSFVQGITVGLLISLSVAVVLLAAFWWRSQDWVSGRSVRPDIFTYTFLLVFFFMQTAWIYVIVFFATGPSYLVHPHHFLSQVGYMTYYIGLGYSFGKQGPPTFLKSLELIGKQLHLGWLAFVPLLSYTVFTSLRDPSSWNVKSTVDRDKRRVLWAFAMAYIAMFLGTRVVGFRHVLPGIAILYAFVCDAVIQKLKELRLSQTPIAIGMTALLLIGISSHVIDAYGGWTRKRGKPLDTGLQVGRWLEKTYGDNVKILTDSLTFYIPLSFNNVVRTKYVEWDEKRENHRKQAVRDVIVAFDPEVIIIVDPGGLYIEVPVLPLLISDPLLQERRYHLVKQFQYRPNERPRHGYTVISVYGREITSGTKQVRKGPGIP